MPLRRWLLAVSFLAFFGLGRACHGQEFIWTNAGGDGLWSNPLNWNPSQVPTALGEAQFNSAGLATGGIVDLGAGTVTVNSLLFDQTTNPVAYDITNGVLSVNEIFDFRTSASGSNTINATIVSAGFSQLLFSSEGTTTFSGVIGAPGQNNFAIAGQGTLTNSNTYTGQTTVSGTMTFAGSNGSALNSDQYLVGGNLVLDNSTAVNTNRLNDNALIIGDTGSLIFNGNPTIASSETVGALEILGNFTTQVISNGSDARIVFQSFLRLTGTTLNLSLSSTSTGKASVLVNNPSSLKLVGGGGASGSTTMIIVPYAVSYDGGQASFLTYDNGPDGVAGTADDVGLRALNPATEYASSIALGTTSATNIRITSSSAMTASSTINSLVVSGGAVNLSPGTQLTISSGAVAMDHGAGGINAITGDATTTFNFGTNEAIFHTASASTTTPDSYTISAPIFAGGGLTKSGPGTLVLAATNSITGNTYITDGTLVAAAHGALGSGSILFGPSGSLSFNSVDQTLSNPISGGATSADPYLTVASGTTVTLNGSFTNIDMIFQEGGGTLRLNAPSLPGFGVESGNLIFNGTMTGSTFAQLTDGTLSGVGDVDGQLQALFSDTIAPGDPLGTLTVNQLYAGSNTLSIRFNLDGAGHFSQLRLLSPTLVGQLALQLNYTPQARR